jgi:hypothetical protein
MRSKAASKAAKAVARREPSKLLPGGGSKAVAHRLFGQIYTSQIVGGVAKATGGMETTLLIRLLVFLLLVDHP